MVYDRNSRDYYGRRETQDYGRDYGSGRSGTYSSAREYAAAGYGRDDDDRHGEQNRYGERSDRYGRADYGNQDYSRSYGDRDHGRDYGRNRDFGRDQGYASRSYSDRAYGQSYGGGQAQYARGDEYHGSYASDGRRFEDVGQRRHWDDDDYRDRNRGGNRDYGRQPQGYDYQDRGFFSRAGDEVRSWFGDEDAERRREADSRYDERYYASQGRQDRDDDYHSWRSTQIAALDRDYDEYRQENRSRFQNEFSSWRSNRQTQRDSLTKVKEHDEVLGSDGSRVGIVDKVRGDRILLTKNDADAGGQHHSIPSSWIQTVADKKVTLSKTAEEAKAHWRTEESNQALFGYGDRSRGDDDRGTTGQQGSAGDRTNLNRSFSGTY